MSNTIVTKIEQLTKTDIISNAITNNQVICIDISENRIGIKNSNPAFELDVSGNINITEKIISQELSCNIINAEQLISNDISSNIILTDNIYSNSDSNTIDFSNSKIINLQELTCNKIIIDTISSESISITINNNTNFSNNLHIDNNLDISGLINLSGDLIINNGTIKFNNTTADILCISNSSLASISFEELREIMFPRETFQEISQLTNTITITSDDRLKHNEEYIYNALDTIEKIVPQIYQKTKTFKEHDYRGEVNEEHTTEIGIIAQELYEINELSFCVIPGDETTPYSVNYNNIFTYGLAGLKELNTKVNNINNRITELSNNIYNTNKMLSNNNNIINIQNLITTQNLMIQTLQNKINQLENKIK